MSVSFSPNFPPFIGACRHSTRKVFLQEFFASKSEKHLGNWSGIVLCTSLSINKIVQSRLNNSGREKQNETQAYVLLFIGTTLPSIYLRFDLYSNRPFHLNSFILDCAFRTKELTLLVILGLSHILTLINITFLLIS